MKDKKISINIGGSFAGLLTITFIVLKILKIINWSWWWVLAPSWIGGAIVLLVIIILLIVAVIAAILDK